MKIKVPVTYDVDIDEIVDWFQNSEWYEDIEDCINDYLECNIYDQIFQYLDQNFDYDVINEKNEEKIKKAVLKKIEETS